MTLQPNHESAEDEDSLKNKRQLEREVGESGVRIKDTEHPFPVASLGQVCPDCVRAAHPGFAFRPSRYVENVHAGLNMEAWDGFES